MPCPGRLGRGCFLASTLFLASAGGFSAEVQAPAGPQEDAYLAAGLGQIADADYEAALFTLDTCVRKLKGVGSPRTVAHCYLYLGVAYAALDHQDAARGKFREALALDPDLRLDRDRFPARVVRLFDTELVRRQAATGRKTGRLWLAGGALVAGGGAAVALTAGGGERNQPPQVTLVSVQPSVLGVVSVTEFILTALATDPDRDPLTYRWDLGDGSTASGETARHVYQARGVFSTRLTADDGRGGTGVGAAELGVDSLTGAWYSDLSSGGEVVRVTYDCTQAARSFGCLRSPASRDVGPASYQGTISNPLAVNLAVVWGGRTYTCIGDVTSATANPSPRSRLDLIGCPNLSPPWRLRR